MRIIYDINKTLQKIEMYITRDEVDRLMGFCLEIMDDAKLSEQKNYLLESWVHNGYDDLKYCKNCALFAKYYSDKVIEHYSEHARKIIREDP